MAASVRELGDKMAENADAAQRKLVTPIYVAIGVGIANLICLMMLLVR